ncbi:MAG: rhodanese-related sulfurtransferase [Cyanobacteria bacterium CRU_2_1]|nr:rhodanese-related sulfurtransferase [Cyanobacteria bacterium RU_5_0]NJR59037.1 rhodanese-related sulfurtransferase [Cyanobacteria bacterium CRU_2_1]
MSAQSFNQPIDQITVEELARRMAETTCRQLIDVREPEELAIANIEGFVNLPLSQFAEWSGEIQTRLDPHVETIVMCHHGMRSAQMCYWLLNQGFTQVKNVTGGIEAYATVVNPAVPHY